MQAARTLAFVATAMLRLSLCALYLIRQTLTDRSLHGRALRPCEANGYCSPDPQHSDAEHAMKATLGLLSCIVPFCRHTTKRAHFREWICGDHWRLVDKARRQVCGHHLRRWRCHGHPVCCPAAARIWRSLVAQAVERAMGIE
jgi:hypothetical protein